MNSYKRLVPGYEAPCHVTWSAANRSALVRVPSHRDRGARLELQSPDPACNPYLAFAACLAAGLDGVERKLDPPPAVTENLSTASPEALAGIPRLPASLDEALEALEADPVVRGALGACAAQYLDGKRREWEAYRIQVTQWELDRYLMTY